MNNPHTLPIRLFAHLYQPRKILDSFQEESNKEKEHIKSFYEMNKNKIFQSLPKCRLY